MSKKIESSCLIGLTFIALLAVGLGTALAYKPHLLLRSDGRYSADLPSFSARLKALPEFCRQLDACIFDHMLAREQIIAFRNSILLNTFKSSCTNNVRVGQKNWLFFLDKNSSAEALGLSPFTDRELDLWCRGIESRQDKLSKRGVKFVVLIGPNKEEIHPEFLSPFICRQPKGLSRLEQLTAQLKKRGKVHIVDARENLIKRKENDPLYFRTDTHWNALGSFYTYQKILQNISSSFPKLAPLSWQETRAVGMEGENTDQSNSTEGDLTRMLGLCDKSESLEIRFPDNCQWHFASDNQTDTKARALSLKEQFQPIKTIGNIDGPKLLMLRDSYAIALVPLLAQHFSRATFLWQRGLPMELVEQEKPDIVVWEFVQRALYEDLNWESELREVEPDQLLGARSVLAFGKSEAKGLICKKAKVFFNNGTFLQFQKADASVTLPLPIVKGSPVLLLNWRDCSGGGGDLKVEFDDNAGNKTSLLGKGGKASWILPEGTREVQIKSVQNGGLFAIENCQVFEPK